MVPYTPAENSSNPIVLTVFIESRSGTGNRSRFVGGINKPVEIIYRDDQFLTGWRMKGGPGSMSSAEGWKELGTTEHFDRPYFFKNTFSIHKSSSQTHPMWRVTFAGLSHGFIFVNGHNLGGYPERIPVNGLYIPECWLNEGENSIIIYDQYGNTPDKITISPEVPASRDTKVLAM